MQQTPRPDTKSALIRAAERLFAEKGLGGVSVKEITHAAGARNESALHYHFGGLEPLIKEVFATRYRDIEEARLTRLAALSSRRSGVKIEALIEVAIAPFLEACLKEDGRLYARFCVQLATDPRFDIAEIIDDLGMTSLESLRGLLVARLHDIPPEILTTRMRRAFVISLFQAADYARQIELGVAPPIEEATREAAVTLCGFLKAR